MNALIGGEQRHYERLGLTPGVIAEWEDGLRTAAADGTFEWWYFDTHLDDGSTVTVEFHTKPPYVSPKSPLTPFVLVTITGPDGTRRDWTVVAEQAQFAAAEHTCDVTIGANTFRKVAEGHVIHVEIDDLSADFTLRAEVPPWRPETGHAFFGDQEEHYIAWLPVVPRGTVDAVVSIGGRTERLTGTGYHDHNWGNVAPRKVLDHWYWGRARVGDYTVVTLMFIAHATFGKAPLPAVMIAEDGVVIASAVGDEHITFSGSDVVAHADTGVPVDRRLEYQVREADSRFTVTFVHERDVSTLDFGAAGAYLRFIGDVTIEHDDGVDVSTAAGRTLWELLYFGDRDAVEATPRDRKALIGHQA
jgi:predicted secreted hydrolase